jgi:DNA polymerase type B, organellar and viral
MDLETRTINGVMTPYCVSIYECMRSQPISFYLSDFNNANDLLKFSFDFNNTKFSLFFRDSYLLLPSSLRKLAINFNVENKGVFPYAFVNDINIPLDYIGLVPDIKYFNNISVEDYNQYYNSFNDNWNFKNKIIKYCEQDCKTLYQIIYNFQKKSCLV